MPKQGISGAFNYGVGYGKILGVLATLEIPTELVTSGVWKRKFNLTSDKDLSPAQGVGSLARSGRVVHEEEGRRTGRGGVDGNGLASRPLRPHPRKRLIPALTD